MAYDDIIHFHCRNILQPISYEATRWQYVDCEGNYYSGVGVNIPRCSVTHLDYINMHYMKWIDCLCCLHRNTCVYIVYHSNTRRKLLQRGFILILIPMYLLALHIFRWFDASNPEERRGAMVFLGGHPAKCHHLLCVQF